MPYVSVNGIKMYLKAFINGKETEVIDSSLPTMIALHGGPGIVDHAIEVHAWSKFSPPLQVIFPDQRGNGLTEDGDPNKWNLDQCGEDVYALSQALGISHPIVTGVSWGGYVAMSYATKYPRHPLALILCNTEAKVSAEARRDAFQRIGTLEAANAVYAYDTHPSNEKFEDFIKCCLPYFSRTKFELIPPTRINMDMRTKFIKEENLTFDFRAGLSKIQCPVLQLAGDQDPVHPLQCAEETAKYIPESFRNLCIIKNAGAPVYLDQPEKVHDITMTFVNSL